MHMAEILKNKRNRPNCKFAVNNVLIQNLILKINFFEVNLIFILFIYLLLYSKVKSQEPIKKFNLINSILFECLKR